MTPDLQARINDELAKPFAHKAKRMTAIGDTVWVFDQNRRVYERDKNGRSYGGPIWREHWVLRIVVNETSRSWLLSCGTKVPKKGEARCFVYSEAELDDRCFVNDHAFRIGNDVKYTKDPAKLRAIAEIIGYNVNDAA